MHRIRQTAGDHQQTLLCEWSLLLANMYADQRKFLEAFSLLNDVLKMARGNDDKELEAATLYCVGHIHLDHHTFSDASDALSKAQSMVKYVNTPLRGAISQTAALAFAFTAQTDVDRTASERMLMQVSKLTDTTEYDPYHVRFNHGRYLLELGDTQIVLKRPEAALDTLDEADNKIGLDQQRRKGYISILRADALTSMKRWDMAVDQLVRAVEISAPIESTYNMEYIGRMSSRIQQSVYAKSSPAVQLRMSIQNYHATHLV
jgi:tetratricopeptide (TPR) repeat protein